MGIKISKNKKLTINCILKMQRAKRVGWMELLDVFFFFLSILLTEIKMSECVQKKNCWCCASSRFSSGTVTANFRTNMYTSKDWFLIYAISSIYTEYSRPILLTFYDIYIVVKLVYLNIYWRVYGSNFLMFNSSGK